MSFPCLRAWLQTWHGSGHRQAEELGTFRVVHLLLHHGVGLHHAPGLLRTTHGFTCTLNEKGQASGCQAHFCADKGHVAATCAAAAGRHGTTARRHGPTAATSTATATSTAATATTPHSAASPTSTASACGAHTHFWDREDATPNS